MGVDACIFAKKSKKYFYFDRLSNIEKFWDLQSYEDSSLTYDLLRKGKGVSALRTLKFLEETLGVWLKQEAAAEVVPHSGWIEQMITFVKAHKDDEFFVVTDHDEPSMHTFTGKEIDRWSPHPDFGYEEWPRE